MKQKWCVFFELRSNKTKCKRTVEPTERRSFSWYQQGRTCPPWRARGNRIRAVKKDIAVMKDQVLQHQLAQNSSISHTRESRLSLDFVTRKYELKKESAVVFHILFSIFRYLPFNFLPLRRRRIKSNHEIAV